MKKSEKNRVLFLASIGIAVLGSVGVVSAYALTQNVNVSGDYHYHEALGQGAPSERDANLGAAAGPDHYVHNRFLSNLSQGSVAYATSSTATAYTLTTTELDNQRQNSLLSWTPNVNTTLTTMASTSAPFVGLAVGEMYEVMFYNASSTAAATVTFAAGTGVDLQEDEGGSVIVNGLELAKLTFLKKADTDVILLVEPYQVGD